MNEAGFPTKNESDGHLAFAPTSKRLTAFFDQCGWE